MLHECGHEWSMNFGLDLHASSAAQLGQSLYLSSHAVVHSPHVAGQDCQGRSEMRDASDNQLARTARR